MTAPSQPEPPARPAPGASDQVLDVEFPSLAVLPAAGDDVVEDHAAHHADGAWTEDVDQRPPLFYGNVDEFVREFLRHMYRREITPRGEFRWSGRWWRSDEAISRLDALWRAWEHLRLDPATGLSVWWRDHADHHMRALLSPEGPFRTVSDETAPGEPLPYEAPPEGLFRDERL